VAASITFYQTFRKWLGDGTFDLDANTFKVTLHTSTYTPNAATQSVYADLTNELATANGYTNGGATLGSVTWTQSGATITFDAADTVWNVITANLVSRYAVIRATGTLNTHVDPLVAYILMDTTPADITVTPGNSLTLQWNASGIFTLT